MLRTQLLLCLCAVSGCTLPPPDGTYDADGGVDDPEALATSEQGLACGGFSDVPTTHGAYAHVEQLRRAGILDGYADCTFRPAQYITREEFAVLLSKSFSDVRSVRDDVPGFSDVPRSRWSYNAILWAFQRGFLNGFPDGRFNPSDRLTYEQAATALAGGLGLSGGQSLPSTWTVSRWARRAVEVVSAKGGTPVNMFPSTFNWQWSGSRAHIAVMVNAIRTARLQGLQDSNAANAYQCAAAAATAAFGAVRGVVCFVASSGVGAPMCYFWAATGVVGGYLGWCGARCPGYRGICPGYAASPPADYVEAARLECRCVGTARYCHWESAYFEDGAEFQDGTCACPRGTACATP